MEVVENGTPLFNFLLIIGIIPVSGKGLIT